jgi:ABC-type polysaccharide/polyol phosphate export permease
MTTQQFAQSILASLPWYLYLLAGIGVLLIIKDIINKVTRAFKKHHNLTSKPFKRRINVSFI